MATLLRHLLRRSGSDPSSTAPQELGSRLKSLEDRVADLERGDESLASDLDWLGAEVKKLRGRVTGGLRSEKTAQDAPGATNDGGAPPYLSPEWFKQKRAHLVGPGR